MNEAFITNIFQDLVFTNEDESIDIDWNKVNRDGILDTDFYRLRLDTFYTFDPSINSTHSGRLYEKTAYISEIDERTVFLPPQDGIFGYSNIKSFSKNIEDQYENSDLTAVGLEIEAHSPNRDKSSVLDIKLIAEWWHLESTKENANYLGMQMDITDNLYQTKPVVGFSSDVIRPMEIYSKAHMVSGSEDGSSRLQTYSGWDKVAGVWFENSNIKYSGKDRVARSTIDSEISYEQYKIPDSGYQHYENELYTKYRIVYSGEEANKYKDARQVTFARHASESVSVERKITRASYSDTFFDDWETLSENTTSPFLDSEELFNYASEEIPVETEDVYEVVPYTGNTPLGENHAEIDIIPDIGWDLNRSDYLPLCLKEDELFFRDGCNIRIRQEGMLGSSFRKYSEAKIYFQDTNVAPLSGYKVEFQVVAPDESRILQLQSVEKNLNNGDQVYFLGQAKGGDSVGEAVWDEEHYGRVPTDSEEIAGISPNTAVESSRKITSATDYGITKNIDRGSPIGPRVVPEEEYSTHLSGQKYIAYPNGVYPEYFASRSFSSAGDLYINFSERSLWDVFGVDSRSFYEQKINREDGVYFKDEREIRTFESGICDGSASVNLKLESKVYDYERAGQVFDINIEHQNGTELGIRDGIISCEPEGDEQNYFFSSSNEGPTDTFRGHGRLNYFMTKDYVLNSYGNVLEIEALPNEKVSLDLPENLFNDGEVYYVERDVYVARDENFQANYLEPNSDEYLGEELHYLTQTFHKTTTITDNLPDDSPFKSPHYFNPQRKFIEHLIDTDTVSNAIKEEDGISSLIIPIQDSKVGVMVQKSESKYFPDKDGAYSSELSPGIYTVSFSGLTLGSYYELQIKKVIDSEIVWETVEKGANKKAKETGLSFSNIDDGTYRLQEWVKLVSYGSVPEDINNDLGELDNKIKYRLAKLNYSMSLKQTECDWIINKNTFVNSNVIHNKALSVSGNEAKVGGFISTVVPGDDYLSSSPWMEQHFVMSSVFSLPNNPHITRNMEGTPFKSANDLKAKLRNNTNKPEYQFNDEALPYYIEARSNGGARVKGGAIIDNAEGEYAYDSFSRLKITKYIYKIYKKHAVLLGDLAKKDAERDYGGWDFELDKSVKDSSGSWGDWQSANVIATDKIRSSYYPAGAVYKGVAIPRSLYFKNYGMPESEDSGGIDDGHAIDAAMLTTDETEKYEPSQIRFRIKKKQIIETDSECRVLSKYNFLPLSLSWDFLKGAKNLAADKTWPVGEGLQEIEIELTDSSTNSYAIKKAENEEVMLLNGEEELAVYGLVEDEKSGLVRRGKISDFKVGEPVKISDIPQGTDGNVKLKIVSSESGNVLTEILKLPSSYAIKQNAKVNNAIKTTHEREVQGHEANFINIGECGDEIYSNATDFECMNEDSGPLVNYEVVASGFGATDDTTITLGGNDVATGYKNDFYNPPFQTSNFTISGDNAGVFVCSGAALIEVTVDTDKNFHVVNASETSNVKVKFDPPLTLDYQQGADQAGVTKPVVVLPDDSSTDAVLSDYSKIIGRGDFKLIEDENIYLEQSDNDKQIVFNCLSKVNLPSLPTTFSFTGVNIATESIPVVSPDNHLINGELVHYLKPRSESKISYANSTFSVETISELETLIAQENIDKTKLLTSSTATLNSSSLASGQIYTTTKRKLEITLHSGLADGFAHAFVIKSNDTGNNIIKIINVKGVGDTLQVSDAPGVIIRRIDGENKVETITKNFPRATLGTHVKDFNFSIASDAALEDWIIPETSGVNFGKRINHIKLNSSSPKTTEINVPSLAKGHHIYIINTSDESKYIEFYNEKNKILSYTEYKVSGLTNLEIGTKQLVRVKFLKSKNQYSITVFDIHKNISNWSYNDDPTSDAVNLMLPDKENTLVVPFEDSIVAKSSLIKVAPHPDWATEDEDTYLSIGNDEGSPYGDYTREASTPWEGSTQLEERGWTGIAVEKTSVSLSKDEEIIFYIEGGGIGTFTLSEDAEKGAVILYGNLAGDTNFNSSWGLESALDHAGKRVTATYDGNHYKSSNIINVENDSHYLIIPEVCFDGSAITTLVGELTKDDDFKVIVLPSDIPEGGKEPEVIPDYHLDYSKFTDVGDKIFVVPLYGEVSSGYNYNSKVVHRGQKFYWPTIKRWVGDPNESNPYFDTEEDENEDVISVTITTSEILAFECKQDGIHISLLTSEEEASGDDSGLIDDESIRIIKTGEKIIRIASEEVKTIDLKARTASSDHSEILIINETSEGRVGIITGSGSEDITVEKRSAAKFTYNTASSKYEKSDVQFYEVVYYSEYEDDEDYPKLKTNKFYDKSDYTGEILLFNTSVKIEGSSNATKWIDRNKYRCNIINDENVGQIIYAHSDTSLNGNNYYILDTPLHIKKPTTNNGLVINKSNSVVNMGTDVLYSDEAWFNGNYLRSLNLRNEDFFIRLSNHTVIPRFPMNPNATLEEELEYNLEEITNFCRIHKLSPIGNVDDWPDGGLYKYGVKLYGNQLNSSKKINFEFDYNHVYKQFTYDLNSYDDLIYGKKIPSRALVGAIGFSVNTGHESIVKCVSFNERTGEVTFSGIEAGKKHIVSTQGYIPLTTSYVEVGGLPKTVVHPTIKYNGKEYGNGKEFLGELGLSTYSLKSLDHANVKTSLLNDFIEQINNNLPANLEDDPDQIQTINQVVNPPVAESEFAWVKMPSDSKTITVPDDVNPDPLVYEDGASSIVVDDENHDAAVGEIYSFPNGVNFTIDLIAEKTLYGTLVGGSLYCPVVGTYDSSKEIKDFQEWGTVVKSSELLVGYRWSNFQIYHTSDYANVGNLLTDDDLIINEGEEKDTIEFSKRKNQWHFIIIKLRKEKTLNDYTYEIEPDSAAGKLIKIKENKKKNEVYVLRREYEDDPQFNKYSEIKGITKFEEPSNQDDGIERVKIGKSEVFIPNDNYTIISTDNQAFKSQLSTSDSERAKASERSIAALGEGNPITAVDSLEERNVEEEQIALNPTRNYANEVGHPAEKEFFTSDILKTSEKIKVRLSRLIGRRVILKDYTDNEIIKNLKSLNIKHQLKYILEGELKSAYAYDEQACKGTVKLGSNLIAPTIDAANDTITSELLEGGDAVVFEAITGSSLLVNKVYFVEPIDVTEGQDKFYLFRAKKLGVAFKEDLNGLTGCTFRVVNKTTGSFCCLENDDYVIINETCFKKGSIKDGVLELELETYSFEYREINPNDGGENYPSSLNGVDENNVIQVTDIFESRNNFVKNFYVIRYHKDDKKMVVIHLTKGRTYRYFIKSNVDKIVHGPSDTITLSDNSKGTFEAKQEKVEIVFNDEVEIENLSSYICILEELKYEETDKDLIFKPHGDSPKEVWDTGLHSIFKSQSRLEHDTGLEDIFLDWGGGRIYDTILPAEISEIYPHEKEIVGGKVELSWIISEKYWDGFWFKWRRHSPKYYTYIIYKNDEIIKTRTVENYLYPKVLAGGFLKLNNKELVSSGSINYHKEVLIHMIEGDDLENGTLEYKAGTNEDYLLYDNKKYVGSASIEYIKGKNIELISKVPEMERQSFITEKETGDTFRVEIIEEAFFPTEGGFNNTDIEKISKPLRLPLNWVSTFSASDIQNTQKFKDDKYDIVKIKFEIFGNVDNKGIVLPDSLLRVNVPMDEKGKPKRFPVISGGKVSNCFDLFRNIFYTNINFSKAKVCIYDPITEGRISNVRILDNGKNYLSEPTITFDEPPEGYQIDDGTGNMIDFTRQAEGVAKLDTEGKISRIEITDPGAGYGWKEGGYLNEKSTDIHPSAYTLLKIKSGPKEVQILGTNHFVGEKFFSYDYQLANATKGKVDPVSVTVKANPDDSSSNTISMGVSLEELDAINEQQFGIEEMSIEQVEAQSYIASEMSEKMLICGSSKFSGTSIPEGDHQDNFTISSEDSSQDTGLIQVTPDDGGAGAEDEEDQVVGGVPLGTSELDNRETDATVSESLAKALGIVNITSLVDYRTIKHPHRNPYPWLSGMSSSTRPDYPMFFGTAPGTEISADAFNNLVDAANSLSKVSIDLPVYVRISKFTKYIYTAVGRAGLSLSFDPEQDYEIDALSGSGDNVWCGADLFGRKLELNSVNGISMPFDDPTGNTLKGRTITTSMKSGKPVATFEYSPETYVKEMRAVISGDIEAEVTHDLLIGCFAKGHRGYEVFVVTKQIWSEYEILPFGSYAKAALGDLIDNINEDAVSYNGLMTMVGQSCSWGPRGKVRNDGSSVLIRGFLWASHYTTDPVGTTIYGPITNPHSDFSYPIEVSAKGEVYIDPLTEVGGVIFGIYGAARTNVPLDTRGISTHPVAGNTFCAPSLYKDLTFPLKADGFMINLNVNKTNGADCF